MYKTTWTVADKTTITRVTYYHLGKEPKFPSWYMEANHSYLIKMASKSKLKVSLKNFVRCLRKYWIIH